MPDFPDATSIQQLLLNPLLLLIEITGTLIPGSLFLTLLFWKGNYTVTHAWQIAPVGYKTKVVAFLGFSYVLGKILLFPNLLIARLITKGKTEADRVLDNNAVPWVQALKPEMRKAINGALFGGVIIATPGLQDRLSVKHAEVAFHRGLSAALIIAAFISGDGKLRWLEAIIGVAAYIVAYYKAVEYQDEWLALFGVGFANTLSKMNATHGKMILAVINSLQGKHVTDNPTEKPPSEKNAPESADSQSPDV